MLRNFFFSSLFLSTAIAAPQKPSKIDTVRWLGRVNPATQELTWPGTGVAFSFTGTSAKISLTKVQYDNSFDLTVDNNAPILISTFPNNTITTPELPKGNHTVVLRRRSETALGTVSLGAITADGPIRPLSAPSTRQIEIIGDSISVGYGLDGVLPCVNNATVTNNPKTYGALAANALNADYHVIAWSGKGIIRNYVTAPSSPDTSSTMPELWTRWGANDASGNYPFPKSWTPHVVVVSLGTNDFGYLQSYSNGTTYQARPQLRQKQVGDAFVAFVRRVRRRYSSAEVFLMTSPLLNDDYPTALDMQKTTQLGALRDAVATLGSWAHVVDWPSQGSDVACDYHPNAKTHAQGAAILEDAVRKVLGW